MRRRTLTTPTTLSGTGAVLSSTGGIMLGLALTAPLAAHGVPHTAPDDRLPDGASGAGESTGAGPAAAGRADVATHATAHNAADAPTWGDISSTRPLPTLGFGGSTTQPSGENTATSSTRSSPSQAGATAADVAATSAATTLSLDADPAGAAPSVAPVATVAVASGASSYTVQSGDTVSDIAQKHGVATASVLALNGLSWSSTIFPGQELTLRPDAAAPSTPAPAPAPSAPSAQAPSASASYTVVSGDTLSGIAAKHGVTTSALFAANGLHGGDIIYPGQTIALPGLRTAAATTPAPPAAQPAPPASAPAPAPAPTPQPAPQVIATLDAPMTENARLIIATGRSIGASDRAIVIALAAAMQESSMRNIDHGDRDSLGLFQQRPSQGWGTPDQVRDRQRAVLAFFGGKTNPNTGVTAGLFDVPGWENLSVTQAAQAVQKSAHPDEYAKWEASARSWLAQLG